jgi:hypothetical protein
MTGRVHLRATHCGDHEVGAVLRPKYALGVDAWLTEDQTHVVKIASNRTPDK